MSTPRAPASAPARGTRPRNRRELIVEAAAELFATRGYANVSVSDIAESVNVGPSALYRHFASKPDIMVAALQRASAPLEELLHSPLAEDLELLLPALASYALDHRTVGVLWQREARQLPEAPRAQIRTVLRALTTRLATIVARSRPDLDPNRSEFIASCALAALVSISFHSLRLPRQEFEELLVALLERVFQSQVPDSARAEVGVQGSLLELSARERILTTSTSLFAARGFGSVTMDEIGAAADMAGPSVYNHFDGKNAILAAAISRGNEWLRMDLQRALSGATEPRIALAALVDSYVQFTLTHSDVIATLIGDIDHLDGVSRAEARRAQHDYITHWVDLRTSIEPATTPTCARIEAQAAIMIANDIAQTPYLRVLPDLAASLIRICRTVMRVEDAPAGSASAQG